MKKILFLAAIGTMLLSGCDLDINEDPNYPASSEVTTDLVFPAVENAIADASGDQMFNYAGFFAQYFDQMPEANQYNDVAELHLDEKSDLFVRCYRSLYAGALADIADILKRTENTSDIYACTVMRALTYQLLVDNMSDAPYSEALMGSANAKPKWDDGQTIYEGVLKELDEAESKLTGEIMTLTDPMLNKNMNQWRGFANALRLRMYMRLIDGNVDASGYTAKVKKLVADNNFFKGDVAWDVFSNAEGQYNPWYQSKFRLGTANHCAALPLVSYYKITSDPRISFALAKASKSKEYVGQIPGSKTTMKEWQKGTAWKNEDVSAINYTPAISMPIFLFTQSELLFLKAEVELRFNNNAAAAKADYDAAVKNDFTWRGAEGMDKFLAGNAVNFDAQPTTADKLKLIYMQKWVALFYRDHMEAWSEARRTDTPALSSKSAKDIFTDSSVYTPGEFVEPAVDYIVAGGLAKRVPYPSTARQLNENTPPIKLLSDKVFWDAK